MWLDAFEKERLLETARELTRSGFKPGCDHMTGKSAELWFMVNAETLRETIAKGRYQPMPVSGFRITKLGGGFRTLSRLTAIDNVLQRCLVAELTPRCEELFSDSSFAYRRGRGTAAALARYCELGSVYRFASKIDPTDCFGTMDRAILAQHLHRFFPEQALVELLLRFASVGIYEDGELRERPSGIPQGAPSSPLLCNIYFSELDAQLEERGVPFIRYADDLVLFGNDEDALKEETRRVLDDLRGTLKLKPNRTKCKLGSSFSMRYLGHRFLVGKDGILTIEAGETAVSAYHAWKGLDIRNPGRTLNVLSDGILRQRDLSLMLETNSGDYDIPIMNTDTINVFSSAAFDSGFLAAAAKRGIVVNVFSKYGHLEGRFLPNAPIRNPLTTARQLKAYANPAERLELAKTFLLASSHNAKLNIRYYRKHIECPNFNAVLEKTMALEEEVRTCRRYEQLLLLEARIRALYYELYDVFITNEAFVFSSRTRRPPKNQINAMLSFGNVVLYSHIATVINKTALDVRVGFLHATSSRMESLNLDIAEIFKPLIVDRTVLTLVNRKQMRADTHFERQENGACYLSAEGKRLFLEALQEKMNTRVTVGKATFSYTEIIQEEVHKLVRYFRTGEKYRPFKQTR
ncbi:MAG: CRISPR-associated endonuclease Cas1 [Oscillospiraceae bacterium]|nr:CRISPR-associated endonuclease Cas1 [Oscillospiraceae bacterium]